MDDGFRLAYIMSLRMLLGDLLQLEADQFVATPLETANDVRNEAALDAFRFVE